MSKKDYNLLATALTQAKPSSGNLDHDIWMNRLRQWEECVHAVSNALALDNSRFEGDRFFDACGWE